MAGWFVTDPKGASTKHFRISYALGMQADRRPPHPDATHRFSRDLMFRKFQLYGFLKNLRFFDPFLVLFFREAGFSFLQIGVLYSIREISTNVLEIPTGIVADAFGRRRAMLASFSSYIGSFLVFYFVPEFWAYALAMVLYAFGETFRSGTHKAMILEHLRLEGIVDCRVAYYGRTRAASQFGSAIASLIAAGLVFYTGQYRIVFLASTVPYVLGLILIATYPRRLDGEHASAPSATSQRALGSLRDAVCNLVRMIRSPILLRGLLNSALFDATFKSTKDYLQPLLQALALSLPILVSLASERRTALVIGILYFGIYVVTSLASAHAGSFVRRSHSLPVAVNLSFLVGIGLLAVGGVAGWAGWPSIAAAAFLGIYLMQNVRRPVMVGYISDLLSHRAMATGLSVESQWRTLIMAAAAPVLGLAADRWGVGQAILAAACVALLVYPLLWARTSDGPNKMASPW